MVLYVSTQAESLCKLLIATRAQLREGLDSASTQIQQERAEKLRMEVVANKLSETLRQTHHELVRERQVGIPRASRVCISCYA